VSIRVELDRIVAYSDHERDKWKAWIVSDPGRLEVPFQPGGRFPTVGGLFDHLFLVERRHLSRLEGGMPPDATGVAAGDYVALFEYGALVRADMRKYLQELDEAEADEIMTFSVRSGPFSAQPATFSMTRRKLVLHMVLHEIRHLAQVAYAARLAGLEPPGAHDYFFFEEAGNSP
jgi:uncharacterized damage-inducible protein DinB